MRPPESWNHYERLGVSEDASEREIGDAHRKLLRDLHPDHKRGPYRAYFDDLTKGINEARDVLLDPRKRSAYDLKLKQDRDHGHSGNGWQDHRREAHEAERRREHERRERAREEYARQQEARRRREEHERREREKRERERRREKEERRQAEERHTRYARKGALLTLLVVGMPLIVLWFVLAFGGSEGAGGEVEDIGIEAGLPALDTSTKTVGSSGPEYRMSDQEGGTMENGAEVRKVYVDTDAALEEDFRDIAKDISGEGSNLDLLWIEFYDDDITQTSALVMEFNTDLALQSIDNPRFTSGGGEEGEGVYILTKEELEGYPSGEASFQAVD